MVLFYDILSCTLVFFFGFLCYCAKLPCFSSSDSSTRDIFSGGIQIFLSAGSIAQVIFSAGSISINGTSINSNAGRFADLLQFRETVL